MYDNVLKWSFFIKKKNKKFNFKIMFISFKMVKIQKFKKKIIKLIVVKFRMQATDNFQSQFMFDTGRYLIE